ncbi:MULTISPECIES: hypothetical protein [unclassified Sutcliffiella]|uniref:MAG6450 family protein n=1 Tax=unclassified Sutcliffiella TaxID=2837532 RepID=UPI0030CEBD50
MKINANTKVKKTNEQSHLSLTHIESKLLGLQNDNQQQAYVALKYFDNQHQCLSEWSKEELKAFSDFCRKVNQLTWTDIYRSGGKTGKNGLGYTVHTNRDKLPAGNIFKQISEDITFFELRVSQKARVHGFRAKSTFFLVWLDKDHEVYKM